MPAAILDLIAVFIFALTGGLVASRAQLDVVGFLFLGCLTGVGGGTLRDLVLGRDPVFWVGSPHYIGVACAAAILAFFTAHRLESRYQAIVWLDALALSVAAAAGVSIARDAGASWPVVLIMGVATGTFGGLMRDVVANEIPLVLRQGELYVSACLAGALLSVLLLRPVARGRGAFAADRLGRHLRAARRLAPLRMAPPRLSPACTSNALPGLPPSHRPIAVGSSRPTARKSLVTAPVSREHDPKDPPRLAEPSARSGIAFRPGRRVWSRPRHLTGGGAMTEREEADADVPADETLDAVRAAVAAGDHDALVALLEPLHEADIADILEQISRPERQALVALWGGRLDGAVLSELEEGVRDEVVAELPDDVLAAAVQELETDDVVYLAEDMEAPQQERILRALDAADRAAVERSLQYEETRPAA